MSCHFNLQAHKRSAITFVDAFCKNQSIARWVSHFEKYIVGGQIFVCDGNLYPTLILFPKIIKSAKEKQKWL